MKFTKALVRWTIGPTTPDGIRCLRKSIDKLCGLYDIEPVICYNQIDPQQFTDLGVRLVNQTEDLPSSESPIGVTWKLYPPRLAIDRHELFIDNDLIIEKKIPELDHFFKSDQTLLLEGSGRNYGRFEKHVPIGYKINSGLFGLPPGFDLKGQMEFYGTNWERNSRTFDEQGLVATSLLNYREFSIISSSTITNCEMEWVSGSGFHFIGLNRILFHTPFRQYCCRNIRFHL